MASGSQNMTTYNARTVTGSNSAASPAGALLLSGAGRADNATGDTWIFLDSAGGTSTPWGIKHDQANNKIHIYGNNTDSVWTRMNTGDTYILGKVGIGYDPETSENLYKLYVNGSSLYTGRLYGNTGNGLEVQSLNTGNWKEGIRIYNASDDYSVLCLCNNDLSDLLSLVHSGSAHSYYIDIENDGTYSKINIPSKHSGTMALTDGYGASGTWGISITGNADTVDNYHASSFYIHDLVGVSTSANQDGLWGSTGSRSYHNVLPDGLSGVYTYGQVISFSTNNSARFQIYAPHIGSSNQSIYFRTGWGTDKRQWRTILHDGNYNNYAPTKTGSGASGTWGISITGSAGSVAWGNVTGKPGSFTPSSHTHDISQVSWAGGSNLTCNGANTEWSIDMAGANSYWHVWSVTNGASCLQCYNSDRHSWAYKLYGAVWNDYAEFRRAEEVEYGRVVIEYKDKKMKLCNERLVAGAKISSDTFGISIGKSDEYNMPIAVSGRVLAFPYQERDKYELGAAVCSAPNGTVDIMTREEIMMYPERILGTVSEIPDYDIWYAGGKNEQGGGGDPVLVKGRIWIYVR